jgi:2-phospho-L-lactate/phosphoenolpyruvate guanylyltransferase
VARTLAVLPVKSFGRAKQRLGDAVAGVERPALAEAMALDVVDALARVAALAGVVVVSRELRIDGIDAAVELVDDPVEAGQSAAASLGVRAAVSRGAERVLLVPGDCPALDPAEVDSLLADAAPGVVIVPDRHGSGTNALLLAPPAVIAPAFGPGSFARHAALARAAGATVRVSRLPSLELDVDTPGDLEALRAALRARGSGAARTRALLERLAHAA